MIEFAKPSAQLKLHELIDLETGGLIDAASFIRRELGLVMEDRSELLVRYRRNPEKPWLVCPYCNGAVGLISQTDRRFHFRHMPEEEKRGCPIDTRGSMTRDQMNAAKYNGAKESAAHLELKELLAASIRADPRFAEPQLEKVWRGESFKERSVWRKPDVQSQFGEIRIAFEIQLSTTFLDVIVERGEFYRAEGASLMWLFKSFDPGQTRRAEEDIFYNNNRCVFIVNEASLRRSLEKKRLSLECWYQTPERFGSTIESTWRMAHVFIDDLTFDQDGKRVFFLDYDKARADLEREIVAESENEVRSMLVNEFEEFWAEWAGDYSPETRHNWKVLRLKLIGAGIESPLPMDHTEKPFNGVVSIILSAKYGKPVGYKFQKLLQVAYTAYESYKHYILPFGRALAAHGFIDLPGQQDRTKKKWNTKREEIKAGILSGDPEYQQRTEFNQLIAWLVPGAVPETKTSGVDSSR